MLFFVFCWRCVFCQDVNYVMKKVLANTSVFLKCRVDWCFNVFQLPYTVLSNVYQLALFTDSTIQITANNHLQLRWCMKICKRFGKMWLMDKWRKMFGKKTLLTLIYSISNNHSVLYCIFLIFHITRLDHLWLFHIYQLMLLFFGYILFDTEYCIILDNGNDHLIDF